MTVAELGLRMSSAEFTAWIEYDRLEPFGEARADLRMAVLATLIANVNRDPERRPEPYTAADFMLRFDAEPEERDEDAVAAEEARVNATMTMMAAAFDAADHRSELRPKKR